MDGWSKHNSPLYHTGLRCLLLTVHIIALLLLVDAFGIIQRIVRLPLVEQSNGQMRRGFVPDSCSSGMNDIVRNVQDITGL